MQIKQSQSPGRSDKKTKFSFVILAWNRARLLSLCLKALNNSIKNKSASEVIIMDNGSTDETDAILSEYKNDPLFKIYKRDKNYGLNSYKKLFNKARGEYVIMIDEDVIEIPDGIDEIFETYFNAFTDYGFLALDVVQNEFTNGAKPTPDVYTEDIRKGMTIQRGPTGAWCSCYRNKDFRKVSIFFNLLNLSMKRSHDTVLSFLFRNLLNYRHGIIKDIKCFHACGPYYSKQFGYLKMQVEKYRISGLKEIHEAYVEYSEKVK